MAHYRYDWDSDAIDAEPAGFTKRWDSSVATTTFEVKAYAGAPKGKALRVLRTAGARTLLSADDLSDDEDRNKFSVRALIKIPTAASYTGPNANAFWISFRASGTASNETGYNSQPYWQDSAGARFILRFTRYVNGAGATVQTFTSDNQWDFDNEYWLRLDVDGTSKTLRIYEADDYALSAPIVTLNDTNSTITADGWIGLGGFAINSGDVGDGEQWLMFEAVTGETTLPALIPEGVPVITDVTPGITTAEVTYHTADVWAGTSVEYRVDGGAWAALGASPATITGLTADTTYNTPGLELRAVNAAGNGSESTAATFTTEPAVAVVKGISVILHDRATKQPRLNVTGLKYRYWDSAVGTGAPLFEGADGATHASTGAFTLDIDETTTLNVGDLGYLSLVKTGDTKEDDIVFSGRVPVSDIS